MLRRRRGSKPLDLGELREVLHDGRVWTALGVVYAPNGQSHYSIEDNDVLVEVQLVQSGERGGGELVTCRLGAVGGALAGGACSGLWKVPAPGTEVAVLVPMGELEADPIIVGVLSSGGVPSELDADTLVLVGPKKIVVRGGDQVHIECASGQQVVIDDGSGSTEPLVRKSEFEAHTHGIPPLQVGGISTGTATAVVAPGPAGPKITDSNTPASITGTAILSSK